MGRKRILMFGFFSVLAVITLLSGSFSFAAPAEINFYMWDDPSNQAIVDAFNASQKEVIVKPVKIPASVYETKILTLLAGGADIDCYMQKRQIDMFMQYKNGNIEPLNKYIKTTKYNLRSIEAYKSQITYKGKVLAIPFRGASYYTYYNKKLFAKAGIPTPDEYVKKGQWNWSKFNEVAKKLSSGDGKQYGALFYTWTQFGVLPALQQNNNFISANGKVQFNQKAVAYSIKMRRDLEKCKASMSMAELKATNLHYSKAFYDGNVGMMVMGEWFPGMMLTGKEQNLLKNFTWNDWGITRMPCDQSKYTTIGICTFAHVFSHSKNKAAAFKFISWMGSTQGAKVVARNGMLPPVVDAGVEKELAKVIPDEQSLKYFTEKVPVVPMYYNQYGSQVNSILDNMLGKYLISNMSEKTFCTQLRQQLTEAVKSSN